MFGGNRQLEGMMHHRGLHLLFKPEAMGGSGHPADAVAEKPSVQICVVVIGRTVIRTFYAADSRVFEWCTSALDRSAKQTGLRRIWPTTAPFSPAFRRRPQALGDNEVRNLIEASFRSLFDVGTQ
jgi:hypothetical protein